MAKTAHRDLPDIEALADQLDQLAQAMLALAGDSRRATESVRRLAAAVDGPVRQAAQVLRSHGQALSEALADQQPEQQPEPAPEATDT